MNLVDKWINLLGYNTQNNVRSKKDEGENRKPKVLKPVRKIHVSVYWARICKLLRRPGINSKESIPPAYVDWYGPER